MIEMLAIKFFYGWKSLQDKVRHLLFIGVYELFIAELNSQHEELGSSSWIGGSWVD